MNCTHSAVHTTAYCYGFRCFAVILLLQTARIFQLMSSKYYISYVIKDISAVSQLDAASYNSTGYIVFHLSLGSKFRSTFINSLCNVRKMLLQVKIKVNFLCPCHKDMGRRGCGGRYSFVYLPWRWMKVSGQLHVAAALPPGKFPLYILNRG